MLTQISVVEPSFDNDTTEISTKLQQLRRLRVQSEGQPTSWHLNSALQAAKRETAAATPEVSYIFIGISLPSSD